MSMITVSLLIMTVLTIFSVVLGGTWTGSITESFIDSGAIVNGTSSTFVVEGQDFVFSIDPVTGFIASLIVIVSLASILGLSVLGSGLSDASVRVMIMIITYSSIWATLSILSYPLIASIEIFGALMYVVITIAYAVGVVQKIDGEES